ncbi:hypothetical protein O8C76_12265, partial [Aliarcobacter butzleri]|nr:hypothetical protein [Aliarcobacter butzleri]
INSSLSIILTPNILFRVYCIFFINKVVHFYFALLVHFTFAFDTYQNVDITVIKELLGHSSIQTTAIYTNPSRKRIKSAIMEVF